MEIARVIGVPIQLDYATRIKRIGHHARVLVDVDMPYPLPGSLFVQSKGTAGLYGFHMEIEYENLPPFTTSTYYSFVGHCYSQCRSAKAAQEVNKVRLPRLISYHQTRLLGLLRKVLKEMPLGRVLNMLEKA